MNANPKWVVSEDNGLDGSAWERAPTIERLRQAVGATLWPLLGTLSMTLYRRGRHLNEEFARCNSACYRDPDDAYVDLATKDASSSSRSKPGVMVPVLA